MSIIRDGIQSADLDAPVASPTLNLDFANSQELDPRITFTRGSIGTFVNKNGLIETAPANTPRFDYDPISGECRGLLIEESRSNLLTYSDDFGTGWFNGDGSVSTNIITAPDGTTNADAFIENTLTNKFHYINLTLSKSASSIQYTGSIWIKDKGRQVLMNLQSGASNGVVCRFQPATGQMVVSPIAFGTGWTAGSFSVVPYPNGWYRVSMTATSDTLTTVVFQLATYNTAISSNVYTGDGTSGIYVWGAQLETGAFPTSYIPTTASTVTRSADNASMTGTNFSSWYNQSEGSIISSCISRRPINSGNSADFAILNSTNSSRIVGWFNTSAGPYLSVIANNNTVFLAFSGVVNNQTNIPVKKAISLADKNMRVATNGTLITGDLGNTGVQDYLPTDFNRLLIGYEGVFAGYLNGTISRLTYYPKALSPAQLQYLTQ
jgi:hypothetical protein